MILYEDIPKSIQLDNLARYFYKFNSCPIMNIYYTNLHEMFSHANRFLKEIEISEFDLKGEK